MIKQKLKQCKGPCGNMKKLFSHGLCIDCFRKLNPPKIKSNPIQNKKQNWIKQCSDKHIERTKKYQKIRNQYFLDNPTCQFPGCNSIDITCHHKGGRVGENLFNNLMSVCHEHHSFIHNNPEESLKNGWLLPNNLKL